MQTFDQALFNHYEEGNINYEEAIRNADSQNELRLRIKLESKLGKAPVDEGIDSMQLVDPGKGQKL
jgi:twitching motility protein PilU